MLQRIAKPNPGVGQPLAERCKSRKFGGRRNFGAA